MQRYQLLVLFSFLLQIILKLLLLLGLFFIDGWRHRPVVFIGEWRRRAVNVVLCCHSECAKLWVANGVDIYLFEIESS